MLGLIKKDLLIIKNNIKFAIIFIVVFAFFTEQNSEILYFVPIFLSTMLFISTFSYDDYNKWDAYACTLPQGKRNVVKAKYLASLLLTLIAVLVILILGLIIGGINKNFDAKEMLEIISGVVVAIVLLQSIMFPLMYKFGVEKGRIGIFLGVFGMSGLIGFLFKYLNIKIPNNVIQIFNDYWFIILPIIIILMILVSYNISKKIYLKKEF